MRKTELKPGMPVRNLISSRIGVVRGDTTNPKRLVRAHRSYVVVTTGPSGFKGLRLGRKGRRKAVWYIPNLGVA